MNFDINNFKKEGKILHILNDFVVKEEVCNLSCDYCLTEGANLKESHQFTRENGKLNFILKEIKDNLIYKEGYEIKDTIDKIVQIYLNNFDAPIFKISGGEVLLIDNIVELIKSQSKHYEVVQILTNGTLINEELVIKFKEILNINIQLSLDGHTLDMNFCRVKTEKQNQRLLNILDMLVKNDITTEIYCVLSKVNIDYLPSFVEYLIDKYGNKVHLALFPVRQGAAKHFLPDVEKLDGLEKVVYNYDKYKSILPPLPYLVEIYDYLKTRRRKSRCYVPLTMFQDFDDGIVTPCPNCWTVNIGNFNSDVNNVIGNIGKHKIYELMTAQPPLTSFCQKCYTDYHLFNLYFDNKITLDEMCETRPLLQGQRVRERFIQLKNCLDSTFGRKIGCENDK